MIPTRVEQLFQQAKTAVKENQFWQAAELYTEVLAETSPQATDPDIKEIRLATLSERGRLLGLMGEQVAALHAYEQYLREAESGVHAVTARISIINQCRRLGRYERALTVCQEALDLSDSLNYTLGRAQALAGIGGTYVMLGRTEEAAEKLSQATILYEQIGDVTGQVRSLNEKGVAYGSSGQYDKAIDVFKINLKLAQQMNRQDRYVLTINNLGECYRHLYALEKAVSLHEEALNLAQQGRLRYIQADILRNLGLSMRELCRMNESLDYLRQALVICEETENLDMELHTLYGLSITEALQGELETAVTHSQRLYDIADTDNLLGHKARALYAQGIVAQKHGYPNGAEELWHRALFFAHESDRRTLLWQIHASLAEIADNDGLATVHYRIAGEVLRQMADPIEDTALRETFLNAPTIKHILEKSTN
jgi:tetratricopeptide (TPR) repeat protein